MSQGKDYLHNHSALERELKMPSHTVLVDAKYESLFMEGVTTPFIYDGVKYIKVSVLSFVNQGGIFKNLMQ